MRIRVLAWNTFAALLRNKFIVLLCAAFLCVVLFMMSPLLMFKSMGSKGGGQSQTMVLTFIGLIMSMVSGFGSLLVAWCSADAIASEMKSGTILAVMARPVRRWEFLLAKFLGVQILMLAYILFMFALSFVLAAIGGARIQAAFWPLMVYPMVRYAIYGALAMLLVTRMHPVFAFAIVMIASAFAEATTPGSVTTSFLPHALQQAVYYILPSFDLLSESRFLTITQAQLKALPWTHHLIVLAYGIDWAAVFFLLAVRSFRRRPLA
jgi:ABC-type transport system involved in multi-copper enzyme maturation permease subunit